jgi:hypothetical protein
VVTFATYHARWPVSEAIGDSIEAWIGQQLVVLDQVAAAAGHQLDEVGANLRRVAGARLDHVEQQGSVVDAGQAAPAGDALARSAEGAAHCVGQLDIDQPDSLRGRRVVAQQRREEHRVLRPEVDDRETDAQQPWSSAGFGVRDRLAADRLGRGQAADFDHARAVSGAHRGSDAGDRHPGADRLAQRELLSSAPAVLRQIGQVGCHDLGAVVHAGRFYRRRAGQRSAG